MRWPWQNEEVVVEVNAGRHVISANELATVCQKLLASGRAGGSCFAWTFLAYFFVSKTKKKVQGLGRKAPYS